MNGILRIYLILGIVIYFYILLYLIKRKMLNLKYSLLWIFSGFIMLVIAIFPKIAVGITKSLGIVNVTNGLFSLIIFFILIILMSVTAIVSKMKENNKQLIQKCAMLEKKIVEMEKELKTMKEIEI
ncbi:DUF2304 domain-containing protein [Clostridium beijerinckii]|uniref:DUF2304 domain-containing protein n=1 Tax=Clostridium beijerinckii TaxID=1520 RepID=UPI0009CFCCC4|nr:DUF2304 domain-containing protein [Clostridium beijerinckii]NOW06510.1 hypothetical protein [Clostridium beijerinckii]NOW88966.1 hypothetical protein [Clostridium beijerinckii]NRT78889.1 hypothetical protein [Clostridium beijerinckii]OOM49779.1 hypothetical protein CBEIJ_10610 [Clostridium beijerinckii]